MLLVGCTGDDGKARLFVRVESVNEQRVCVTQQEGREYEEYSNCYFYDPRDSEKLLVDACVEARFPWPDAQSASVRDRPISEVRTASEDVCDGPVPD